MWHQDQALKCLATLVRPPGGQGEAVLTSVRLSSSDIGQIELSIMSILSLFPWKSSKLFLIAPLISGKLHTMPQFEKARAIIACWPELFEAISTGKVLRFHLGVRGFRIRFVAESA